MDSRLLKDYSYYLKVERSLSANTAEAYSSDLEEFFSWYEKSAGTDAKDASTDDIISWLSARNVSARSQARALSALRSFYSWLQLEGERKDNPAENVDSPKIGRHLPDVLSVEEVTAIIESVDTSTRLGRRDRAILEVLYGCGLRVSEASSLHISDVFLKDGFVRVVGKGNKQRVVPLGEDAADAITAWLEVRGEAAHGFEDTMFLNKDGCRLSRVSIFNMIKRQAIAAGVNKVISPHTFRHSFATHLVEGGADLRAVQEMLGHESILTTEIYTHIDKSTWQRNVLSHHPDS